MNKVVILKTLEKNLLEVIRIHVDEFLQRKLIFLPLVRRGIMRTARQVDETSAGNGGLKPRP